MGGRNKVSRAVSWDDPLSPSKRVRQENPVDQLQGGAKAIVPIKRLTLVA